MRVLTVIGNRPQFVKSAPLSLAFRDAGIEEVVLHTGQHWDPELSQVFFDELGLGEPRYRLDLHTADPDAMRPQIADAVERERPDWVVVLGDTNSTRAGAEAAGATPVAHVEAGLRSGDLEMPEERNRIAVDRIAHLLLCPDERSLDTLAREAVPGGAVVVGDVMADAVRLFAPLALQTREQGTYLLCTVHREANVRPERLARIVEGLNRLDEPVLFPAHPRTRAALARLSLAPHVELMPPQGYLELAGLATGARVILTDSGGLQKEAYWYGVPCVTLRPSTEWVDTVELGANVLVDDDPDRIVAAVAAARMPDDLPPLYGDGHASERVAAALLDSLSAA